MEEADLINKEQKFKQIIDAQQNDYKNKVIAHQDILKKSLKMIEKRLSENSDQEIIERAFNLLKDLMEQHPDIEPTLWAGACWSALAYGYSNSDISYQEFTKEWDKIKHFYKPLFD